MRKLLLILGVLLILPMPGHAVDDYNSSDPVWRSQFSIEPGILIRSVKTIKPYQKKIVFNTYLKFRDKFINHWKVSEIECEDNNLEVRLVRSLAELNNRQYFPPPEQYADEDGDIYGRYYPGLIGYYPATIYLAPVGHNWAEDFSHELTHYYFDKCEIDIDESKEEQIVEKLVEKWK